MYRKYDKCLSCKKQLDITENNKLVASVNDIQMFQCEDCKKKAKRIVTPNYYDLYIWNKLNSKNDSN